MNIVRQRYLQIALLGTCCFITTFVIRAFKEKPQLTICTVVVIAALISCLGERRMRKIATALLVSASLTTAFFVISIMGTLLFVIDEDVDRYRHLPTKWVILGIVLGCVLSLVGNIFYFNRLRVDRKLEKVCTTGFAIAVLLMDFAW